MTVKKRICFFVLVCLRGLLCFISSIEQNPTETQNVGTYVWRLFIPHVYLLGTEKDAWNVVPVSRYWKVGMGMDGALRGAVVLV